MRSSRKPRETWPKQSGGHRYPSGLLNTRIPILMNLWPREASVSIGQEILDIREELSVEQSKAARAERPGAGLLSKSSAPGAPSVQGSWLRPRRVLLLAGIRFALRACPELQQSTGSCKLWLAGCLAVACRDAGVAGLARPFWVEGFALSLSCIA